MDVTLDRFELKYPVARDRFERVQRMMMPYLIPDPGTGKQSESSYTVRSIYLDSVDLRFYHEKMDGVKRRKKVRLRTYGGVEEGSRLFLEIKHRIGERILKERVTLPWSCVDGGTFPEESQPVLTEKSYRERRTLDKVHCLKRRLNLAPTLLVTYKRKAYYAADNDGVRITFDYGIRSRYIDAYHAFFTENGMSDVCREKVVIECKFYGMMPGWLKRVLTSNGLSRNSVSKYCLGHDACESNSGTRILSTA